MAVAANALVPHGARPAWINTVGTAGAASGPRRAAADALGGGTSSAPPTMWGGSPRGARMCR